MDTVAHRDELASVAITLPGGFWDEKSSLHTRALLRPLTGRDEELMAELAGCMSVPSLVTWLISRCMLRLGSYSPVSGELAGRLLVGDRDYILLKLRQLSLGNHLQAVVACTACDQKIDLDFKVDQVPIESRMPPRSSQTFELSSAAAYQDSAGNLHRDIEFRLPTGADQEALALFSAADFDRAIAALLARCVSGVGEICPVKNEDEVIKGLGSLALAEISTAMAGVAPIVGLDMDVHCPHCETNYAQYFDFSSFLIDEIKVRRRDLYREVHCLAIHYHWGESEIMALTRAKRRTFLDLLSHAQSAGVALGGR